jgi:anaerobic selenocysteine-containing dehydrogenase
LKGGMAARTIALLPALTGALFSKGGGITRSTAPAFALNTNAVMREDLAPAHVRIINMVELGNALTKLDHPPLKALHVYHSNPAVVAPDSSSVLMGLAREDLFTVVHEHFLTETALYADIVLPATTSLESTDLYRSYGHYYLQMAHPAIPPVGESRSTLQIFQALASRFGFSDPCFTENEEQIIRRLLESPSPTLKGITYARLSEGRPVRLNVPERIFSSGFGTPSGQVEFYSQTLADQGLDPLPDGAPSLDLGGESRYPLQLITPPRHTFLNSTFNEVDALRAKAGEPTIMINPRDAALRGIDQGMTVRVYNDRGECFLFAEVTDRTSQGVSVIEGLYWPRHMPGKKGVNHLTSQHLTDMGQSCAFHCNLVEVEAASAIGQDSR